LASQLLSKDGKWPNRPLIKPLVFLEKHYPEHRQLAWADINNESARQYWKEGRTVFNEKLMKPDGVEKFAGHVDLVSKTLVPAIEKIAKRNPERIVDDLEYLLKRFSLECAMIINYGEGLNLMEENLNHNLIEFISSGSGLFNAIDQLLYPAPDWEQKGLAYEPLQLYLNSIIAMKKEMKKLQELVVDKPHHSFFAELQKMDVSDCTKENALFGVLAAGVDTTVKTMTILLYNLSIYPEVQDKIRAEIAEHGTQPENLKYLRNTIKESMRLYPTAVMINRLLTEDITLDDYLIPKDTNVVVNNWFMGRDPRNFYNPEEFNPDRKFLPYTSLPFGLGARMCPGRRLAETELAYSIAHIIKNFKLEYKGETHPKPKNEALLGLDIPIKIKFEKI